MSDPYAANTLADDIVDDLDTAGSRLSAKADRLLDAEPKSFDHNFDRKVESVRQALKDDVENGRAWARERADMTRLAIQDEPIKAAAYAVGVGVLIGLLLRR